jgi:copper chaperone CopZ
MKILNSLMLAVFVLLSSVSANAQIKNKKTETVKIFGNCDMCKANIEKAGNVKKIAQVNWDKDTRLATLTYDAAKTNSDEILKRIALEGYDSEKFLAPDSKYNTLHACCQYDRDVKEEVVIDTTENNDSAPTTSEEVQKTGNQLESVYTSYFTLKDALVKTDAAAAAEKASEMLAAIESVQMDQLPMDVHMVWMKALKNLTADTKAIASTTDIKNQRAAFKTVSTNIYDLLKVAKAETPTYYQYCPMVKANWLSKEAAVKNPYYGASMLTCGSTVETIK